MSQGQGDPGPPPQRPGGRLFSQRVHQRLHCPSERDSHLSHVCFRHRHYLELTGAPRALGQRGGIYGELLGCKVQTEWG